jgi:ABC-type uncharacterized transport system permease subunit
MRAVRLAWLSLRIGALAELQYRVNFFLQLLQSLLALATALVVLALVLATPPTWPAGHGTSCWPWSGSTS